MLSKDFVFAITMKILSLLAQGHGSKGCPLESCNCINRIAFEAQMPHIKLIFLAIHKFLSKINLTLWSRHAFGVGCKTNMLINNLPEAFNPWIKAHDKHIIAMCETIRRQLLNRLHKKKVGGLAAISHAPESLCPKVFQKLKKIQSHARVCV